MKRCNHRSCTHIPVYMAVSDRPENPDSTVWVPVQFTCINHIVQLQCTALKFMLHSIFSKNLGFGKNTVQERRSARR